jgi:hypothetical protein
MSEQRLHVAETTNTEAQERFEPRGIGSNCLACFVCDGIKDGYTKLDAETREPAGEQVPSERTDDGVHYRGHGYHSNQPDMAAFVDSKEAGERVVGMFQQQGSRAFLDFRPSEPNWVQVKIGACDDHLPNLEGLQTLVHETDGMITPTMIAASLAPPEIE